MIILDENIDQIVIDKLKAQGFELYSIKEHSPGINDEAVIEKVKELQGILITEDKDFGELVFANSTSVEQISVIYLKTDNMELSQLINNLVKLIIQYERKSENYFITVDRKKIRVITL